MREKFFLPQKKSLVDGNDIWRYLVATEPSIGLTGVIVARENLYCFCYLSEMRELELETCVCW